VEFQKNPKKRKTKFTKFVGKFPNENSSENIMSKNKRQETNEEKNSMAKTM